MEVDRLLKRLENSITRLPEAEKHDIARWKANAMFARKWILRLTLSGEKLYAQQKQLEKILLRIEEIEQNLQANTPEKTIQDTTHKESIQSAYKVHKTTPLSANSLEDAKPPSAQDILMERQAMADAMTQELLRMAQGMKANAHTIGKIVEQDQMLIQSADNLLGKAIGRIQSTNKRLMQYRKTSKGTFWLSLISIGVVFISFIVIFVLTRIT